MPSYQKKEEIKQIPMQPPAALKQLNNIVPIPLANQAIAGGDILNSEKQLLPKPVPLVVDSKLSDNKVLKEDENAARRRDILDSVNLKMNHQGQQLQQVQESQSLHREKRDTEVEEANVAQSESHIADDNNQMSKDIPAQMHAGSSAPKAVVAPSNSRSVSYQSKDVNGGVDQSLIKTAAYLSDPEVPKKLDSVPVPNKGTGSEIVDQSKYEDVKPMKRDLKYVSQRSKKELE